MLDRGLQGPALGVTCAVALGMALPCLSCQRSAERRSDAATNDVSTEENDAADHDGPAESVSSHACNKGQLGPIAPELSACNQTRGKSGCDFDHEPGTADDLPCWYACGPVKSGTKVCTCIGGDWVCPTCAYDVTDPSVYTCFRTDNATLCPADLTDPAGTMLPASGAPCALVACDPCGSADVVAYRDSTGSPKKGWCVCVPREDGLGSVYSCASVVEWAPVCDTKAAP